MSRIPIRQSGVILAGGRSSRMGRPKMAIRLEGASLLARTTSALLACCDEVLVIAAPTGSPDGVEDALHELGSLPQLKIRRDPEPYKGPLPAIVQGLSEARGAVSFVTAGDSPLLAPALVGGMLATLENEPLIHALIPQVDGHPQPLTAAYRSQPMRELFAKALARGENSPRRVLQGASLRELSASELRSWDPELRSFLNINNPEDLERVRSAFPQAMADSADD
jgi:molybdopterin-guanine dinucleotide biosynthesis protein A